MKNNLFSLIIFVFTPLFFFAQVDEKKLVNSYNSVITTPKEIAYIHVNKSIFLKNEELGFSAYILDKTSKQLSLETKNLYVTLSDKNDKVVKKKLIQLVNGFANNSFKIDSSFSSGKYTFRAYTNWMLNFNEPNFYEQVIKIIDPNVDKEIKSKVSKLEYDVNYFPEGGHLVNNTKNTLGILVKDQNGFGLPEAEGKIIDGNGEIVQNFKLNQFGIAKTTITPNFNQSYKIVLNNNNSTLEKDINSIQDIGFNLSIKNLVNNKIGLVFRTNSKSLEYVQNKNYLLAIHNGSELKTTPIKFNNGLEIVKIINKNILLNGVNIFTVFDSDSDKPILERIYFNNTISKTVIKGIEISKAQKDSLQVALTLNKPITNQALQNFSISVLPSVTKSYTSSSTLQSKVFLESYVKGFVENASYYFSSNSAKIQSDLDHLLLTQGWSSFNWEDVFKKSKFDYKFEKGITAKVLIGDGKFNRFFIYPLKQNPTRSFELPKDQKYFFDGGLFPSDNEIYKISSFKKNRIKNPNLIVEFTPNKVPAFKSDFSKKPFKDVFIKNYESNSIAVEQPLPGYSLSDTQVLDEVVIESNKEAIRIEKIKNSNPFGKIEFINENTREQTIEQYLRNRGLVVYREGTLVPGQINPLDQTYIFWTGVQIARFTKNTPIIILDGKIVDNDPEVILNYAMSDIDYIEINRRGIGYDIRGTNGVINIATNPGNRRKFRALNDKSSVFTPYKFPLKFSASRKFYVPQYQNYDSAFFKAFGTIAWYPELKTNDQGKITFKIPLKYKEDITLYIEGLINGEELISSVKKLKI